MRTVMACTGLGDLADRWAALLREQVRALDVAMLDSVVPDALRGLWSGLDSERDLGGQTATVYHFGVDGDGTSRAYAYRSTAGFVSQPLPHGMFAKPMPAVSMTADDFADLGSMVALASRIRAEQAALPAGLGVRIGGELTLTQIDGRGLRVATVHRFDDFDAAWVGMHREV